MPVRMQTINENTQRVGGEWIETEQRASEMKISLSCERLSKSALARPPVSMSIPSPPNC